MCISICVYIYMYVLFSYDFVMSFIENLKNVRVLRICDIEDELNKFVV